MLRGNKNKYAIFRVSENQLFRQGGRGYGEKIYKKGSLCSGTYAIIAQHGGRGKDKAQTGSKEKDCDGREDLPNEIKRCVGQNKSKMENQ